MEKVKFDEDAATNLYLQLRNTEEVAKQFKISKSTIWKMLKSRGVNVKPLKTIDFISDTIKQKLVENYKNGKSIRELCIIYNISESVITNYFISINLQRRTAKEFNKKYCVNDNFFSNIDSEEKAYFLGLLVSDGCNNRKGFRINLQEDDKYILEKFKETIEYTGSLMCIKPSNPKHKIQFALDITSEKICEDLSKLGVVPAKSHKTYFPDIPEHLWHHFIRGVFDGDGWINVYERGSTTLGIVGNNVLINRIQEILIEKCGLSKTKVTVNKYSTNIISFYQNGTQKIISIRDYLYKDATIYLTRKYKKLFSLIKKEKHREDCKICGEKYHCNDLCKKCYHKQYLQEWRKLKKKNESD